MADCRAADPNIMAYSKGNTPKFWQEQGCGIEENGFQHTKALVSLKHSH